LIPAANLSSADLYGADLRSANLSSANLYGADLSSTTCLDYAYYPTGDVPVGWIRDSNGYLSRAK
jgi:uncharacterized protein YjbI with pentapeptide repeats